MVTIQLDQTREERLQAIAAAQGRDAAEVARTVVEDYLDFQALGHDTPESWAEASVAMAGEFFQPESWSDDENQHKPR